jgi:hypothetical protein
MVDSNTIEVRPDSLAALRRAVLQTLKLVPAPHTPLLLDRLPLGEGNALTSQFAHRGIVLSFPSTTRRNDDRGRELVRVDEEVRLTGLFRIGPKDQDASLDAAWAWEEVVAETIRRAYSLQPYHPQYKACVRAPAQASAEWWVFTMTFTFTREIR